MARHIISKELQQNPVFICYLENCGADLPTLEFTLSQKFTPEQLQEAKRLMAVELQEVKQLMVTSGSLSIGYPPNGKDNQ